MISPEIPGTDIFFAIPIIKVQKEIAKHAYPKENQIIGHVILDVKKPNTNSIKKTTVLLKQIVFLYCLAID